MSTVQMGREAVDGSEQQNECSDFNYYTIRVFIGLDLFGISQQMMRSLTIKLNWWKQDNTKHRPKLKPAATQLWLTAFQIKHTYTHGTPTSAHMHNHMHRAYIYHFIFISQQLLY